MKRTVNDARWRAVAGVVLIAVSAIVLITGIRIEFVEGGYYQWFEAESGKGIEPPMEIAEDLESSGKRCIEIKQGKGTGMLGSSGRVEYSLPLPGAGDYVLWARVYWLDGCSNSFFVITGGGNYHFGEDANFNTWHWVRMNLPVPGMMERIDITIRNREDGIKIDKFLLTNDLEFVPQGMGAGLYVCDFNDGSVGEWGPNDTERWRVVEGEGLDNSAVYSLDFSDSEVNEYSLWNVKPSGDYVYRCLARNRNSSGGSIRLLFDYRNRNDFSYAEFVNGKAVVVNVSGGAERIVGESHESMHKNLSTGGEFHLYEINKRSGEVVVKVDGMTCVLVQCFDGAGSVGLGSLQGSVLFDDVYLSSVQDIRFSQNFYYDVVTPTDVVNGWSTVRGDWIRTVTLTPLTYDVEAEGLAIALTGEKYWNNYMYEFCVQGDGESGIGMLFYYYDNDNAYLFRWGGRNSTKNYAGRKQLLKAVKDEISVMAEEPGGYTAGQWYRFKVSIMDGAIKTYIDNRLIFDVVDRTIFHGRVGLWIDGPKREADAGMVRFWPGRFAGDSWKHQFAIQMDRGNYQHAVYFCYQNNRNHYVLKRLAATGPDKRALLRLFRVVDGISVLLDQKYDVMEYPKTYSIVVTKLGDRLMLDIKEPVQKEIGNIISNAKVGFEISNPFFTGGRIGYDTGRAVNARFDDVVVRSIHDFNDPFAADELGNPLLWKQLKGNWKVENGTLTSVSGNTSVAIAGQRDWSDYVYSVDVALCGDSIQPAGLLFYYHDEGNNYRLDFGGSGAGPVISLVKKIKGVETILDTATRGGLLRSFETFSVELDDGWIGVYNNGERIAGSYDFDLKDGEIGLYGHGVRSSIFDNVNVSFDDGDDALNIVDIDFETYDESMVSMDGFPGWTVSGGRCSITDGSLMIETSGGSAHLDYRDDFFYGNVSVLFGVRADGMDNPHVNIMLYEDGGGTNGGYIFTFDRSGASLYKGGVLVASSESQTMRSMEKYLLRIDKRRGHILCFIDGQCVIARRDEGYTIDYCTAVSMDDGLLLIDEIRILGFPAYHNDFSLAKLGARDLSNWYVGTGDWNVVSFHGYGLHGQKTTDGDASIYFKDRLPRNASIEFEIYPLASNPSGHFVVSIYNDGEDYYSGYLHHIEYNFIESAKDVYSNYVNVTVMKNDDVLKTENRIIGPREERKTKFRIVKIDDVLKLYISNILIYELHGVDPPGGNMMSLGVMGARFNPTFINYVSVYAID